MIKGRKIHIFALFILFISLNNVVSHGYGYWDNSDQSRKEVITIGDWDLFSLISSQFATDISTYIDNILENNPNSLLKYIYTQNKRMSGKTVTIEDIEVYGYIWDFTGFGTSRPIRGIGYVSLIDRAKDINNEPIHPISTPNTSTPSYAEYNYFTSYDVFNTQTNNQYSLRLNYGAEMITNDRISNVETISFYASRGLSSSNDALNMDKNRSFSVEISTDGNNWDQIGYDIPSFPTSSSYAFEYYSYNIPLIYQGQDIFIKIHYNGEALKEGRVKTFSRLVIDELVISTGEKI